MDMPPHQGDGGWRRGHRLARGPSGVSGDGGPSLTEGVVGKFMTALVMLASSSADPALV